MLFFDVSNSGATGDVWNAKVNGVSVAACDTTGKLIGSKLKLTTLPTADPVAAGEVWNDAGTLKISAG